MQPLLAHQILFLIGLLAACAYAGVRGGKPERIVAALFLVAGPVTGMIGRLFGHHTYLSVEIHVLLVDVTMFVVLLWLALLSARFWPMPMASMQAAELLGHLAKPLGPTIIPPAYYALVAFWSVPMLVLLTVGTIRHRRRLAIYKVDHAWAAALPPAYRAGGRADEH